MSARTLSKDIQNQAGSRQYTTAQRTLQIAFLAGTQRMIEDNQLCPMGLASGGNLV